MQSVSIGTLQCSRLAYGCWRVAGTWNAGEVTPEMEEQGLRSIIAAYEAGYTLFDHADVYCDGVSETLFGRALKRVPEMRRRVVIASKSGIRKGGQPLAHSPYRYDFSAEHLLWSCEQSLQRLGVETIDLYQLHRPDYLCDPAEVADVFLKLQKAGKVREFGVSNFHPSQLAMLQQYCPMKLTVNQVEMSLGELRAFQDGTLDQCLREKILPLAWSPLHGGKLGTRRGVTTPSGHPVQLKLLETLDAIALERNVSRTVIALAWLLRHPAKIVPILGSTRPETIREATGACDVQLTRDEWYRLLEAARGERLP